MSISNGRDQLQRVAFEMSDGTFYKFAINPQSITESYGARNIFQQTEQAIQMQGYGQGLHTIVISGTTGVRSIGNSNGTRKDVTTGYDRIHELRDLILTKLNSGHDTSSVASSVAEGSFVTLTFHDFTDGNSWIVELNTDGFQIARDVNNPLSYTYTISMVVIGDASTPATSEVTWIELGNKHPSLTPTATYTGYEYKYGKDTLASDKFDAQQYTASAQQFKMSKKSTIDNYGQTGMYSNTDILSPSEVLALYKVVYPDIISTFDWASYVASSGYFTRAKLESILDYDEGNAGDSGDASKDLTNLSIQQIFQTLYGQTVNDIDIESYEDAEKVHQTLYGSTVNDLNVKTSTSPYQAYENGTITGVTDYGLSSDKSKSIQIIPVSQLQLAYSSIYNSADGGASMSDLSDLYSLMRSGSLANYQATVKVDSTNLDAATSTQLLQMYSVTSGQTASASDIGNYEAVLQVYANSVGGVVDGTSFLNSYTATNSAIQQESINANQQTTGTSINQWEAITDSTQANYVQSTAEYTNPIVSQTAPAYTYYTAKNILRI